MHSKTILLKMCGLLESELVNYVSLERTKVLLVREMGSNLCGYGDKNGQAKYNWHFSNNRSWKEDFSPIHCVSGKNFNFINKDSIVTDFMLEFRYFLISSFVFIFNILA